MRKERRKKLGIITIGQSPRPDVVKDMSPFFGENVQILERGALDGLPLEKIKALSPERGMLPLGARLSDGTGVVIAKEKILPFIKRAVAEMNEKKASLILLLCVGSFPAWESESLVVHPQRIIDRCVDGLIDKKCRLGIVIPISEQEDWARKNFSHITPHLTVTDISPYSDGRRLSRAKKVLKEADCDLIVMYCLGFTREWAREIRVFTGKPVILSSSLVARTIGELLD